MAKRDLPVLDSAIFLFERIQLFCYVREHEKDKLVIQSVATALKRDYKNVHSDVGALLDAGLLHQDEKRNLYAPYDEALTQVAL